MAEKMTVKDNTTGKLRPGFTTGSCAAAAAKAAAYMLLFGREKKEISIVTPKGIVYHPQIVDIQREKESVSCAVIKDGGDDPDSTSGAHICARVTMLPAERESASRERQETPLKRGSESGIRRACIFIDGGSGVGRVTKPGLDQPVGNAAINHVPREMIEKEVGEVCEAADFYGSLSVVISVPEGEEIAKSTFNPRLGIVGGISIIGTSGIVEPMSTQALLETIRVELRQKKAEGQRCAAVLQEDTAAPL